MNKFSFVIISALLISGCAMSPPLPEDHFYQFNTDYGQSSESGRKVLSGTLIVKRLRVDGLYSERAIAYSDKKQPYELQHYHYHLWLNLPSRLIENHMIDYFRHRNVADLVMDDSIESESNYIVSGSVKHFAQVKDGNDRQVRVSVELVLSKKDGVKPIMIRVYNKVLKVKGSKMSDSIEKFQESLESIYDDFLQDVTQEISR